MASVENVGGAVNDASGGGITQAFTVTSANLLLVGVTIADPTGFDTAVAPTWNGTGMTLIAGSEITGGGGTGVRWYRLFSPAAGSFDVVLAPDAIQAAVHIIGIIDADIGGTPFDTPATATNTTANPSVAAGSASGDIVVGACSNDNQSGDTEPTGGQGFTEIFDGEDLGSDYDHNSLYKTASGASTTMSFAQSGSGTSWAFSAVAVKGTGGGEEELDPVTACYPI